MNESDTRLHKIDPMLKKAMWGVADSSRIMTEYPITKGKISQTVKNMPKKADYLLMYKGAKLACARLLQVPSCFKQLVSKNKYIS